MLAGIVSLGLSLHAFWVACAQGARQEALPMIFEEKISTQWLCIQKPAEALDNVSRRRRLSGIYSSQFYEFKRRFQTHGLRELKELLSIPEFHPISSPKEVVNCILQLSPEYPSGGGVRLSNTTPSAMVLDRFDHDSEHHHQKRHGFLQEEAVRFQWGPREGPRIHGSVSPTTDTLLG
jgi:hypothetical protein